MEADNEIIITKLSLGQLILDKPDLSKNIEDQIREEMINEGKFVLNILAVGRRNSGIKTLINSLFNHKIIPESRKDGISVFTAELIECSACLEINVTVYSKPSELEEVQSFINNQNKMYFDQEMSLTSDPKSNTVVHCCIYALPVDGFTNAELEVFKRLTELCNVIPVVTKLDNYLESELIEHKKNIMNKISDFCLFSPIMAVTTSEVFYEIENDVVRGRNYPWGFVSANKHGDFLELRNILINERYNELLEKSFDTYYLEYRSKMEIEQKKDTFLDDEKLFIDFIAKYEQKKEALMNQINYLESKSDANFSGKDK